MRVCYIISTCDKYLNTRVKYQMNTFLKDINKNDIYYLTSKPNKQERQFGWNCMDDEKNITWKYIHFIYNMTDILNYDWYIFIDDDTFVFKNRLENYLKSFNKNDMYYIGYQCQHENWQLPHYLSGGAGYAISSKLYNEIFNYIRSNGINNSFKHWCDDLCIGMWIDELSKKYKINRIHNSKFLVSHFKHVKELDDALTAHQISTIEENNLCYALSKRDEFELNNVKPSNQTKTVFVLVTDLLYFNRAKRTIIDLRSKGKWFDDIVLITIDFSLNKNFKEFYNIIEVKFEKIDTSILLHKIGENGFSNSDKREINKLNQWEKLHVFDDYFMKWNRIVFLDAGLRVLDDVKYLLDLDFKDKILAPKDGMFNKRQTFGCQLSYDNLDTIEMVKKDFGEDIFDEIYFLNCIWIYDTNILRLCDKKQLIEAMNIYTLCRNNEMGIMNLLFRFKYNLWEAFPFKINSGKILFDWSELNNPNTNWRDYCYIKYPVTISFDDC
jgi:hypothetical protein